MTAMRSTFGDLLEPGFTHLYNDAYQSIDQMFPQIFNVLDSDKQDERDSGVSGFGMLVQKPEAHPIAYEDPVQLYDVVYTHLTYAKGFKISKEMYDDDQYNVMNSKPQALGKAARRTEEQSAANVFNNAFSTSQLGGDGKPLISTTHPSASGGSSQSNASSTGLTFKETNYETARIAFRRQLDDKGQKIATTPKILLVPIEMETQANILFNSNLRSGTADNDMNPYKGSIRVIPWIYLSSTTAWFLIDPDVAQLKWYWRERANFAQDTLFETDVSLFKVRERFSNGFSDWRGIWGSAGDGNAYAG